MDEQPGQATASYLINELGIEWRLGAQWFEEMLIDYDPVIITETGFIYPVTVRPDRIECLTCKSRLLPTTPLQSIAIFGLKISGK